MYVAYCLPGHATGSDKTRASLVCSYRLKPMDSEKKTAKGIKYTLVSTFNAKLVGNHCQALFKMPFSQFQNIQLL